MGLKLLPDGTQHSEWHGTTDVSIVYLAVRIALICSQQGCNMHVRLYQGCYKVVTTLYGSSSWWGRILAMRVRVPTDKMSLRYVYTYVENVQELFCGGAL